MNARQKQSRRRGSTSIEIASGVDICSTIEQQLPNCRSIARRALAGSFDAVRSAVVEQRGSMWPWGTRMHERRLFIQQFAQCFEIAKYNGVGCALEQQIHLFPVEACFLCGPSPRREKAADQLFAILLIPEIDSKVERCHQVEVSRLDVSTCPQQNIYGFRGVDSHGNVQRSLAVAIRDIWIKAGFQQQRNTVPMAVSDSPRQHAVIVLTKCRFEIG